MKRLWRIWLVAALVLILRPGDNVIAVRADEATAAQTMLESMTVAERVGQLFLVTFEGDKAFRDSDVADLITNFRIGGVLLLAENDNITGYGNPSNASLQMAQLTNDLQRLALLGTTTAVPEREDINLDPDIVPPTLTPSPTPSPPNTAVPLLIATNHEGDKAPYNQIRFQLTEVPNNMAIGATWQPQYAETVGEIVGQELSAIGINMLLGPSLDVLEEPAPFSPSDLGTRSFGGDPYWVGEMGQAYTRGVHNGSQNRMAVVAKHFPGIGSSDRPIDQEVPTVRKSQEQLKQIELAPFFAATGGADDSSARTDALLATHIRYQGFQGNIRATTNPISFDPQALTTLMQLPQLASWRQEGGVIVSDALGVRAVERFYDDTQGFPHRRVAKDALLAGNDLLILAEFALGDAPYDQQLANIKNTILWFREKYETDQSFQQRVDEAVLRILQLKLRLYGEDFSADNVLVDAGEVSDVVGHNEPAIFDLAQAAITLISPSPAELAERLASPPGTEERIAIFTDVREVRQCSTCPPQPLIAETALEDRILALYGSEASNQVEADQIQSFSFADLQAFLDAGSGPILLPTVPSTSTLVPESAGEPGLEDSTPTPVPTATPPSSYRVQEALQNVDWIIFAMLDVNQSAHTLSDFLARREDIVRNTRVIVFAYDAPYYLDSTEISKLTAYFGVYSKIDVFIDASVRALFQELPLNGASPVNVEGINYSLFRQTQPDPNQVIELFIVEGGETQSPPSAEPLETSVGDTLHLQTGVILDHNGNPVPDGTPVQFIQRDLVQGLESIIAEVPTTNGVAQLDYLLEARTGPGQFRITAVSGEAGQSEEVDIIIEGAIAAAAIFSPTPAPTSTATASPTPTATPSPTTTPTPQEPTGTPVSMAIPPQEPGVRIELSEFQMLTAVVLGLLLTGTIGLTFSRRRHTSLDQQVAWPLWGLVGSLLVYNYFALGLPGTTMLADLGSWAGLVTTMAGGVAGLTLYRLRQWA